MKYNATATTTCLNFLKLTEILIFASQKLSLTIQDAECYKIFVMTYKPSTPFPALLYVVVIIRPMVA